MVITINDLKARQLINAQAVYRAALPFGRDAVMAALMTAGAESSYLIYANNGQSTRTDVSAAAKRVAAVSMTFDHDAVAGEAWTTADSVGLFQQRPSFGYGTVADLMDPARSTVIFLTGNAAHTTRAFMDAPDGLTLAQRCQWTQGSEFPTGGNYAPFQAVAAQLIERFSGITAAPCDITEWITMADQQALAAYAQQIAQAVFNALTDRTNYASLRSEVRYAVEKELLPAISDVAGDVGSTQIPSVAAPGKSYSRDQYTASADNRLVDAGKVDAVLVADRSTFALVKSAETGVVYAYRPGTWYWINGVPEMKLGQKLGIYPADGTIVTAPQSECDALMELCLRPSNGMYVKPAAPAETVKQS